MKLQIILLLLCNIIWVYSEYVSYENYQVYRVTVQSENSIKFIQNLPNDYDVWSKNKDTIDVLVPPNQREEFLNSLKNNNLESHLLISNVEELITAERVKFQQRQGFNWTNYHTLDEINNWLSELASDNPKTVSLIKVGTTYEGRDIQGVHVSYSENNRNRSIFVEGNIHAREWISSAVVTYILNELINSNDPNVRQVAESHDWYVVPVYNADGFEYTHTTDRLWRKTRVPYGDCVGADPNRNWGYHFNDGGADNSSCSNQYSGPYAFSEPCTKSISEFISTIGDSLIGYISFHCYAQQLLIPYGYTEEHLDNYDELKEVGLLGLESLKKRYGTEYGIGNVPETMYIASGGSFDWVKGTFGTRITYTYELRDTGKWGVLLPPEQIIPTGEETLDSFITILQEFDKRPEENKKR